MIAHYANGVKLVLDFLKTPFGDRPGWVQDLGTCPVRFVGDEGWVEAGDSGGNRGLIGFAEERAEALGDKPYHRRAGCLGPCPQLLRLHQVAGADRGQPAGHAALAHRLPRGGAGLDLGRKLTLDPVGEEFVGDDEANRLRSRAAREPWCLAL